jgi:LysM repeat protein
MNKLVIVLGVAAVATITGCKDPGYKRSGVSSSANEAHVIDTGASSSTADTSIKVEPAAPKECQCPAGTKHTKPCECGLDNCKCIVETKAKPLPPPAPEYATYVVQNGDYLAKISRKFNVTIPAIKSANSLKGDVIRVGQKLRIPGVDAATVAEASKQSKAAVAPKAAAKAAKPYTGETKEYVVKSGDTLGAIAYGSGINIRQLKAMNSLKDDRLKVGQKLKIPAVAVKKAAKTEVKKVEAPVKKDEVKVDQAVLAPQDEESVVKEEKTEEVVQPVADEVVVPAAPAPAKADETFNYTVLEGEDITAITIRWGVSASKIRELNNLADDAQLTPGQVIKLPAEVQQ